MDHEPVGVVEIADRLKVSRKTVDSWRQRRTGFPEPKWLVGNRPAWDWRDVHVWAQGRGLVKATPTATPAASPAASSKPERVGEKVTPIRTKPLVREQVEPNFRKGAGT